MNPIIRHQSMRTGILFTAFTFSMCWSAATQAAPPPDEPTFAKASISIAPRDKETQEIAAGDLICSFRETGLGAFALISYECRAAAAAVVEGCFFRNKFVPAAGTEVTIGLDVSNVEAAHEADIYIANNSGAINGEVVTAIPEAPHVPGGGHLCAEPLEAGHLAHRHDQQPGRRYGDRIVPGVRVRRTGAFLRRNTANPIAHGPTLIGIRIVQQVGLPTRPVGLS